MKTITVDNKDYVLEYTFAAAEHRGLVQKMFNVISGAYVVKHSGAIKDDENAKTTEEGRKETEKKAVGAMVDGVSEMVSEIPHICITAFYAGLLENNPLSEDEAKNLMKTYMKENKISFKKLYTEIKECMEDDGFFDLSGLTEMMNEMNESVEKQAKKAPKQPQDHKNKEKKSTSAK